MREFDWNKFLDRRNNIAVLCKTKEEAKSFCKAMHEHGLSWSPYTSYLARTNFKERKGRYSEGTCYSNQSGYCDIDFYRREGYEVWEYSDFMMSSKHHWYNEMIS